MCEKDTFFLLYRKYSHCFGNFEILKIGNKKFSSSLFLEFFSGILVWWASEDLTQVCFLRVYEVCVRLCGEGLPLEVGCEGDSRRKNKGRVVVGWLKFERGWDFSVADGV